MKTVRIKNTIVVNGKRKTCRIWDTGEDGPIDRYTIAYRGWHLKDWGMVYPYAACNGAPFHPQGFGQHGELRTFLRGRHLGRRVRFETLPNDVQKFILQDLS